MTEIPEHWREWLKANFPDQFVAPNFEPEFEPSHGWTRFARDMTLRSVAQRLSCRVPGGPLSDETVKLLVLTWAAELGGKP